MTYSLSHFTEKVSLCWVAFSDIMNENIKLRNVFRKTLSVHNNQILKYAYLKKSTNTTYIYG